MRRQSQDWDAPPLGPPLGQRLARFVALIGVTFAITAAVIVTRRLSEDSLALLIGLSCGVIAMVPALVLGFVIWRREEAHRRKEAQHPQGYGGAPPVIVVTPQGPPGYGYPQQALPPDSSWVPARGQREFTIVGGEE